MTTQLALKLQNLAASVQASYTEAVREYGPKLRAAAEDVELKLESWTSAVDHWVTSEFADDATKLRHDAGSAYRAAVQEAHKLIDEAKALL